jgi:ubiquinone/menaquinone biosynthesis C-methylase UbiE
MSVPPVSAMSSGTNYLDVTEIVGEPITAVQLARLYHRYHWAVLQCVGRDVVEAACGTGPGLGLLAAAARSLEAGDYSPAIVDIARRHYGSRLPITRFDAQKLPFADQSKDVLLLFEAIYYVPDAALFARECARVLRPGGRVLVVTVNKDLYDFHPSAHSVKYYGVRELGALFAAHGFACEFSAIEPASAQSLRQRLLRPVKRVAVMSGLMPKSMAGKRWLKRIVFGPQSPMPAEVTEGMAPYEPPRPIAAGAPDLVHRIIYCVATRA